MTFERFDVHVVDFPHSDTTRTGRRPALVLCDNAFAHATGNVPLAMITSAEHSAWPGDCPIDDLAAAGLRTPCKVRLRFVTLATSLLGERIGQLAASDAACVQSALRSVLLPAGAGTH